MDPEARTLFKVPSISQAFLALIDFVGQIGKDLDSVKHSSRQFPVLIVELG